MLPKLGQAFDSDRFSYEVKRDGVRTLAFIDRGVFRLVNRRQHNTTDRYPELGFPRALAAWNGARWGNRRPEERSAGLRESVASKKTGYSQPVVISNQGGNGIDAIDGVLTIPTLNWREVSAENAQR